MGTHCQLDPVWLWVHDRLHLLLSIPYRLLRHLVGICPRQCEPPPLPIVRRHGVGVPTAV